MTLLINVPIWIWILAAVIAVIIMTVWLFGLVFGFRRFRRMEKEFDEMRQRTCNGVRRT